MKVASCGGKQLITKKHDGECGKHSKQCPFDDEGLRPCLSVNIHHFDSA